MPYVLSPAMELPVPAVGTEPGPEYALDINNCMSLIDQHDHTSGRGVPITPDAISITGDLSFDENNATDVRSVRFDSQPAALAEPTDLDCIYVVDGDLYYNDGDGNDIRLTQNGAIVGTPGSIAGLVAPASASYNPLSSTFIWQSNTNTPAIMDCGPVIIRELVASGFGITLEANASIAANYTLTLPAAAPATNNALTLTSSSGAQSFLSQGAANEVPAMNGAGNAIAYKKLTQINMGDVGSVQSASSGNFSAVSTGGSYVDVTNLSVTLPSTTGRPVLIQLVPDGSGTPAILGVSGSPYTQSQVALLLDGVVVNEFSLVADGVTAVYFPTPGPWFTQTTAGSHTYKIQVKAGTTAILVRNWTLVAFEL
jgi:hypothetical protein